jgi:hypothetical protein
VLDVVGRLTAILDAHGSEKAVDMVSLLKREALDVIGVLRSSSQNISRSHACMLAG